MSNEQNMESRRPLASRKIRVFHALAHGLIRVGLTPNQVSVLSVVFAAFASWCFYESALAESRFLWLFVAAVGIQLRLVCNLIDGLMAVEGKKKSPVGDIYNDFPDRLADVLIILGAGLAARFYSEWAMPLAWLGSLAAVMTAYVRVLGASLVQKHFFLGPMAKPQRMFALTLASLISGLEPALGLSVGVVLYVALVLVTFGSAVTCWRRLNLIAKTLRGA